MLIALIFSIAGYFYEKYRSVASFVVLFIPTLDDKKGFGLLAKEDEQEKLS